MAITLKPGNKAPVSAQYGMRGPRGGYIKEVTVTKGETLPPGPKGATYVIKDRTDNKSGGR